MKYFFVGLFILGSYLAHGAAGLVQSDNPRFCKRVDTLNSYKICAKTLFYAEQVNVSENGGNLYISDRVEVKQRIIEIVMKAYRNSQFMSFHKVDDNFPVKIAQSRYIFLTQAYLDMSFVQIYALGEKGEIHRFKLDDKNISIDWFAGILDVDDYLNSFDFSELFGFNTNEKVLEEDFFSF